MVAEARCDTPEDQLCPLNIAIMASKLFRVVCPKFRFSSDGRLLAGAAR